MDLVRKNDFFNLFSSFPDFEKKAGRFDFTPRVEISENEKSYLVEVEIPGVQKEDVKVTFENHALHIRGEKKAEKKEKSYSERFYGSFYRSIPVSKEIEIENISAKYEDGVLKLELEKKFDERKACREISIQ